MKPCVQRGQTQTMSIHVRPNMGVVVDTRYADGKDGQAYGGIDYGHKSDAHGDYHFSWLVSPVAPLGQADTLVGVVDQQGTGNGRQAFRVALKC